MLRTTIAGVALVFGYANAATAKDTTIALDLSGSNPLIESEEYATVTADYVRRYLSQREIGDYVRLTTFGGSDLADNLKTITIRITRRTPAEDVAEGIASLIANISEAGFNPQQSTNIVGFLELNEFNCEAGETVLIITDGLESSEFAPDANEFLTGKVSLEPFSNGYLDGCHVVMVGLGQTAEGQWPVTAIRNVRRIWNDYFEQSGASFDVVVNPNNAR